LDYVRLIADIAPPHPFAGHGRLALAAARLAVTEMQSFLDRAVVRLAPGFEPLACRPRVQRCVFKCACHECPRRWWPISGQYTCRSAQRQVDAKRGGNIGIYCI